MTFIIIDAADTRNAAGVREAARPAQVSHLRKNQCRLNKGAGASHHQLLSTVGALACCADGGCWKSRCQPVGDGDQNDQHDLRVDSVQIRPDLRIPR